MTCHCTKDFCYNCGAIEIDDHKCINGCPLFESELPEYQIRLFLCRELKEEEKDQLERIKQAFIKRT